MQQLMRKMGQRMIMVLIIALLLVNFVICNSTVKADAWPKKMSVTDYQNINVDGITIFKQDLLNAEKPERAVKNLSNAWNISIEEVINILTNHQDDPETLYVNFDGSVYTVDTITVKLTEDEKSTYGIATDADGNASVDMDSSITTNDNDAEGGEGDIGGILFRPIASLICGIGDTFNKLLQILLIDDASDVFITERFTSKGKVANFIKDNEPASGVETVPVVKDNIKLWIGNGYGVPNIKLTPAEIFAGNVAAFDANFFETNKDYSNKLGGENKSIVLDLKNTVAQWYVALRNIAIVGLLSVLLYIGIRIVISSSAGDKAKYKQLFVDWVVALCLIFFLHYIMSFAMTMADTITDVLSGNNEDGGSIKQVNIELTNVDGSSTGEIFSSNFAGVARIKAQYKGSLEMMGYSVLYLALTLYTVYFSFIYLKRLLMLAFFTMIAPLVALTYPLDKIKDGHAQAFNYWFKEYMFYAILQPLHMLLYTVFVSSALSVAASNMLYAIVALAFIVPAEKIVKQMFGIKGQTESSIAGFAGGAIAAQAFNALKKGPNGGNKNTPQANNNKVRQAKNPNAPDSMETLAGDAMGLNEQALAAGTGAAMGASAATAMTEEHAEIVGQSVADTSQRSQDSIASAEKEALEKMLANGEINESQLTDQERKLLGLNEPKPAPEGKGKKKKEESKAKAYARQLSNNFSNAVKKRYVAAGGAKGIAKSALKGYGRLAGTVALGAIGLGAGIVGGDMGDTLKGMGAGLAAGSVVSKRAEKMIENSNSAIGNFASDVFRGDEATRRNKFIQQYMNDPATASRILDKDPDMDLDDVRAQQRAEAEMMYDTGIDDYSTIKSALSLEKDIVKENKDIKDEKERKEIAHNRAVATAKLSQNYDKNTFTDQHKYDAAQQALKLRLEKQMNQSGANKNMTPEEVSKRANAEAAKTLERIRTMKKIYK